MSTDNTCNLSIFFGSILIGLLITVIILKHRKQYEQFFDTPMIYKSTPAPYPYTDDNTTFNINKIISVTIISILIGMVIIMITTKSNI